MATNFLCKVYISTFAVMKDIIVGKTVGKNKKSDDLFVKVLALILATLFLLIIALIVIPCAIFRAFLYIGLKLTYRNKFGGFLTGMDNFFELNPESVTVNAMIIYRFDGTRDEHIKMLQKYVATIHHSMYKFSSTIENCCGFLYYVKDQVTVDDVLDIVELDSENGYITKDMFYDYAEQNCFAIVENKMWKTVAFVQPIRWDDTDQNGKTVKRYPIIIRIKHSIGDGPSIIGTLKRLLVQTMGETKTMKIKLKTSVNDKMNLDSAYVHRNPLTTRLEGNILKLKDYDKWHLAIKLENGGRYLPIIKKIKDKLNVRLMDVISAAVCSSILDYIAERDVKVRRITTCSVVRAHNEDLPQIVSGQYDFKKLANDFSLLTHHVPFKVTERSMKTKILTVYNTNQSLTGAVDVFLSYGFLRLICSYIPIGLMKLACKQLYEGATILISNLVGVQRSVCMGCEIDDAFFCVPNLLGVGFFFTIFTYDGKLEVAVSCKRGYVRSRQELQTILNNVFKYLDQAKEETLSDEDQDAVVKKHM